jgi:hypothetical protein
MIPTRPASDRDTRSIIRKFRDPVRMNCPGL